jgi:hypothetical protein
MRLVISYGTPCCSLDPKMPDEVAAYIAEFEQSHGVNLAVETLRWGENGETNACYALTEIEPALQQQLVAGLRDFTARSARTFVREHEPCTTHTR